MLFDAFLCMVRLPQPQIEVYSIWRYGFDKMYAMQKTRKKHRLKNMQDNFPRLHPPVLFPIKLPPALLKDFSPWSMHPLVEQEKENYRSVSFVISPSLPLQPFRSCSRLFLLKRHELIKPLVGHSRNLLSFSVPPQYNQQRWLCKSFSSSHHIPKHNGFSLFSCILE